MYEVLTGNLVEIFSMRSKDLIRDVRWHPFDPVLAVPNFSGTLYLWTGLWRDPLDP